MSYQEEFRSSNWCTLVYPESANSRWIDRLRLTHIPFAVSPLHDKDVYVQELEQDYDPDHIYEFEGMKKPHYHVVLKFDSLKSLSQVKCILAEALGDAGVVQPFVCHSLRQMVRYFAHLDDPQKYPYDFLQTQTYGLPLKDFLTFSPSEANAIFRNIMSWIRVSGVDEFEDVWNYALDHDSDWCDILTKSNYSFNVTQFLSSRRNRKKENKEVLTDNGMPAFLKAKEE